MAGINGIKTRFEQERIPEPLQNPEKGAAGALPSKLELESFQDWRTAMHDLIQASLVLS